ncbi:hypothetical protein NE237_023746 [Protea cynaroides]|uniref:Glycosyltransferase n=1 Tax=Protea cynaroides TaxID=273540 RepID=A0A9Q0HGV2_9MAGN|nr:hypothetical protein NE237_023746 [Protea cynaroides]
MEGAIVLYPMTAVGHLVSMVELGKLILRHYHHRFSVTILIGQGSLDTPDTTSFIHNISQTTDSITFHFLPILSVKPSYNHFNRTEFTRLNNPNLRQALQTISKTSRIRAFVIDFFSTPALTIASDLDIPTYYFITSGAVILALLLYLPVIHNQITKSFKDIPTTHLHFPGLPPMLASDLPERVQDRESQAYSDLLEIGLYLRRSNGIITNTFDCLEPTGIKAITDGLCVPDAPTPPLYCIGPLIASPKNESGEGKTVNQCMSWLDAQPRQSVVFLSFGSRGVFSAAQVREIAIGLENSGQRFLWVVREPVSEDNNKHWSLEHKDPNLEALLPDGFLDRTKERGFVVKLWAPQVEVLNHESVGGFVTHCGWNSVLEAVRAGVPMVAWPLYAEQCMNKAFLVEDMKLAMPMEESENGLVTAAEVEKRMTALMKSEEGRLLRERSRKMKEEAMFVWSERGSSMIAFTKLAESWVNQ